MRCSHCNKKETKPDYWPYCSYHCQEWGNLIGPFNHPSELKDLESNERRNESIFARIASILSRL